MGRRTPLLNLLNKIVLYVFDENDNPVRNAMKDLSPSISYGGVSKGLNLFLQKKVQVLCS
jgi:hypothetical protein